MKKKLIFIVLAALIAAFLLTDCAYYPKTELEFCEGTNIDYSKFEGTVLKVYNWGYYISDGSDGSIDVNKEFEMLTGIDVVYDNYDSNESLYAKIKNGGADYDVIIPSDYYPSFLGESNLFTTSGGVNLIILPPFLTILNQKGVSSAESYPFL